jgi:hypothetical protein
MNEGRHKCNPICSDGFEEIISKQLEGFHEELDMEIQGTQLVI